MEKRIIVADNQPIFRAGVAKTLAVRDNTQIIAQFMDKDRLTDEIPKFRRSIIIFASSLQADLPSLIQSARKVASKLIIIAENFEFLHTYATHGFDGVVFRDVTGAELVKCVENVATGQTHLQLRLGRCLTEELDAAGARVRDRLNAKEIKIVGLIVQGHKNKEIANQLCTTEQVIKNYLSGIYDKTGVSTRLGLALFTIYHHRLEEAVAQHYCLASPT